MSDSYRKLSKELRFLITIMCFLLLAVFYPFYMKNGYDDLGGAKFSCYRVILLLTCALLVIPGIVALFVHIRKRSEEKERTGSGSSIIIYNIINKAKAYPFYYGFAIVTIISFLLSKYPEEALFGTEGWFLGLFSQLSFLFLVFLMKNLPKIGKRDREDYALIGMRILCAVAGIQFVWGILNRFEIYPVHLTGEYNVFIASLGNINWYCGYWSICFPIITILYLFEKKTVYRVFFGVGALLGFAIGFLQGGSSAYLVLVALLLYLGAVALEEKTLLCRFFELLCLCFLALFLIRMMGMLFPGQMNYETNLLLSMSETNRFLPVSIAGMIVCAAITYSINAFVKKEEISYSVVRSVRILVPILLLVCFLIFVLLMVLNQVVDGGISPVNRFELFHFSADWGNQRGIIWIISVLGIREMSGRSLLFGVGPDCYSVFLYSFDAIGAVLRQQFGEARLACAHNEALQMFICQGAAGLFCYAGIFVSYIKRTVRELSVLWERKRGKSSSFYGKEYLCYYAILGSVICYLVNNIVSFQQLLSTPFLFLLIGMGEGLLRRE